MKKINHWINGKNVAAAEYFHTTNPATGEVLAEVASGGADEVNQAVAAAKEAFPKWANLPMKERARLMRRLGDLIDQNVPEIAAMETADTGLPIHQTKNVLIPRASHNFEFFAEVCQQMNGKTYPVDDKMLNYTLVQPVGVCALVVLPWGLAIAKREPDFWRYFFWVEHIQRFAEKDAQHKAPFWYYIPFLIAGSLPWLALLPGALKRGWTERDESRGALYLLGWVAMPFLFFSIAKGKLPTYILPCFAPLSILMARYALDAAKAGAKVLKINGAINLAFGLIGLVAVLVVSPWGIMHKPVWSHIELYKCLLAALIFGCWALMGWLAMKDNGRRWTLAACCPLGLALLVGFAIPDRVIDSKQPQFLVDIVSESLTPSRYVLTNNVGIAGGLSWELKRSDIILFDKQGELKYGLSWPDAQHQFVDQAHFADWLATHRQQGPVSLVLLMDKGESMADLALPKPDSSYELGRVVYIQYLPQ